MTESESAIHFGTDGWRAVIADKFTVANLQLVTQAYADYVNDQKRMVIDTQEKLPSATDLPLILIGFDQRFLSENFARHVADVLVGNNIGTIVFSKAVPTPLVSWGVRQKKATGGVIITASHNPAEYNGLKIKTSWGGSAQFDIISEIEARINFNLTPVIGRFSDDNSQEITEIVIDSYRAHVSAYFDLDLLRHARFKVVIDSIHGSGEKWIESFLQKGTIEVETIRSTPDPLFGGVDPEPIERNLGALKKRVTETGAILGLATDGDADRLGATDEHGHVLTMHEIAPLVLLHLIRNRRMTGEIISSFSQSIIIKRIAASYNLPFCETPIGFKHISALMHKKNVLIGAEESGGIGINGHLPERDGIFNSLLLLEAVVASRQTPSELIKKIRHEFGEFYFERHDIKLDIKCGQDFVENLIHHPPLKIAGEKVVGIETIDGVKFLFIDESWLLLRQSGTEPLLRIYAEATSILKTKSFIKAANIMIHKV